MTMSKLDGTADGLAEEQRTREYLDRVRAAAETETRLHGPMKPLVTHRRNSPDLISQIAKRTKERLANPPSRSALASGRSRPTAPAEGQTARSDATAGANRTKAGPRAKKATRNLR